MPQKFIETMLQFIEDEEVATFAPITPEMIDDFHNESPEGVIFEVDEDCMEIFNATPRGDKIFAMLDAGPGGNYAHFAKTRAEAATMLRDHLDNWDNTPEDDAPGLRDRMKPFVNAAIEKFLAGERLAYANSDWAYLPDGDKTEYVSLDSTALTLVEVYVSHNPSCAEPEFTALPLWSLNETRIINGTPSILTTLHDTYAAACDGALRSGRLMAKRLKMPSPKTFDDLKDLVGDKTPDNLSIAIARHDYSGAYGMILFHLPEPVAL